MNEISPEIKQSLDLIASIKLLPELENLFSHTIEQVELIEKSILSEGYDENQKMTLGSLDGKTILVDGYTRFHILKAHGILFKPSFFAEPMKLENLLHAKQLAFSKQLNRRNLSPISLVFSCLDTFYQELKENGNQNIGSTQSTNNGFSLDKWIHEYIGKQIGLTYISHLIKIWKSNSHFLRYAVQENKMTIPIAHKELQYPDYDDVRTHEILQIWDKFPELDREIPVLNIDGEFLELNTLTIEQIRDFRKSLHIHDSPQKSRIPIIKKKRINYELACKIADLFGLQIGLDNDSSFEVQLTQLIEEN